MPLIGPKFGYDFIILNLGTNSQITPLKRIRNTLPSALQNRLVQFCDHSFNTLKTFIS